MRRWHQEKGRTKREHVKHMRIAHGWPKKGTYILGSSWLTTILENLPDFLTR